MWLESLGYFPLEGLLDQQVQRETQAQMDHKVLKDQQAQSKVILDLRVCLEQLPQLDPRVVKVRLDLGAQYLHKDGLDSPEHRVRIREEL